MSFKELFATDKLLHAGACFVISIVVSTIFSLFSESHIVIGACTAIAFGIGKELYDIFHYETCEWNDIWADLIGALTSALCLCVIEDFSVAFSLA